MVEVDDGKGGTIKVPGAYRNIVLDSNSGGNSFHFHAGNKAGTARITCTVTNPADKQIGVQRERGYCGGRGDRQTCQRACDDAGPCLPWAPETNTFIDPLTGQRMRNNVGISAFVMDDANQPVPEPVRS
jgi:hypothetical protein